MRTCITHVQTRLARYVCDCTIHIHTCTPYTSWQYWQYIKVIAKYIGEKIEKADAEFAKEVTGFTIGGIPPLGHVQKITTYIDEDLLQYKELWAAAGMPNAVFSLTPKALKELSIGEVVSIK